MTTTTISERSTGWIFYKRMWKMLLLMAAAAGYYSPAAVLLHAWIIITFFGQMTWWDRSKKWLIVSCTRVWGKECYLDILQCGMDLSLTDCYTLGDLRSQLSMQYSIHMYKIKLRIVTTYYDKFILIHLLHPDSSLFYIGNLDPIFTLWDHLRNVTSFPRSKPSVQWSS